MANEKRLIDANAFLKDILTAGIGKTIIEYSESDIGYMIRKRPTVDAVEVVRCHDCVHAVPLERNCELNTTVYMECTLGRGEEIKNVWHKYKRYYRDYSIVEHESFCDQGERMNGNGK